MAIHVGHSLTALAAIMGAERLLLRQLREVDPDALYRSITSNRPLDPRQMAILVPFYRNNPQSFIAHYTADYILKKIREARPDLWTLITSTKGGVQWVTAQRAAVMAAFDSVA